MAHWNLADANKLIQAKKVWFSCYSRSVKEVMKVFKQKNAPKTEQEAGEYILEKVMLLKTENFSETVLCFNQTCDVYGEYFDNVPWYIKFSLKDDDGEDCFNNLSFHPPEKPFKTAKQEIKVWDPK